jgi:hypothetical protein
MLISDVTTSIKVYRKSLLDAIAIELWLTGMGSKLELAIKAAIKVIEWMRYLSRGKT